MDIIQTNRFRKAYKKLTKNQLAAVNEAIRVVVANPQTGEQKIGDLSWLSVYKFKCLNQLMLLDVWSHIVEGWIYYKRIVIIFPIRQIRCSDPHVQTVHCGLALRFSSFLQEKSH